MFWNVLKCFEMCKNLHGKGKTPPSHTSLSQCFEFSDMWQKDHFGRPQVVTHLEGEKRTKPSEPESPPELPNIRSCCVKNNVTHASCVDRFVDVCVCPICPKCPTAHSPYFETESVSPILHIVRLSIVFKVLWPSPCGQSLPEWPDDLRSLGHWDVSLPCWWKRSYSLLCCQAGIPPVLFYRPMKRMVMVVMMPWIWGWW